MGALVAVGDDDVGDFPAFAGEACQGATGTEFGIVGMGAYGECTFDFRHG